MSGTQTKPKASPGVTNSTQPKPPTGPVDELDPTQMLKQFLAQAGIQNNGSVPGNMSKLLQANESDERFTMPQGLRTYVPDRDPMDDAMTKAVAPKNTLPFGPPRPTPTPPIPPAAKPPGDTYQPIKEVLPTPPGPTLPETMPPPLSPAPVGGQPAPQMPPPPPGAEAAIPPVPSFPFGIARHILGGGGPPMLPGPYPPASPLAVPGSPNAGTPLQHTAVPPQAATPQAALPRPGAGMGPKPQLALPPPQAQPSPQLQLPAPPSAQPQQGALPPPSPNLQTAPTEKPRVRVQAGTSRMPSMPGGGAPQIDMQSFEQILNSIKAKLGGAGGGQRPPQ